MSDAEVVLSYNKFSQWQSRLLQTPFDINHKRSWGSRGDWALNHPVLYKCDKTCMKVSGIDNWEGPKSKWSRVSVSCDILATCRCNWLCTRIMATSIDFIVLNKST